jgi:hypothetical protein
MGLKQLSESLSRFRPLGVRMLKKQSIRFKQKMIIKENFEIEKMLNSNKFPNQSENNEWARPSPNKANAPGNDFKTAVTDVIGSANSYLR